MLSNLGESDMRAVKFDAETTPRPITTDSTDLLIRRKSAQVIYNANIFVLEFLVMKTFSLILSLTRSEREHNWKSMASI